MQNPKIHGNSTYTAELGADICARISEGEPLVSICRDETMPSYTTVMGWLNRNVDGFAESYVRAREAQADADADAITDIGRRAITGEIEPSAARVAIEAYKWSASRRAPKKYGDKITQEHTGTDGGPIQTVGWVAKADDDLLMRIAALRAEEK